MKTILGFDSWLGGGRHYKRLVSGLNKLGYRLLLIHLGSWGGDPGHPETEWLDDLEVRDIAYYKGLRFDQILEREHPSAVIFLSNDVFAHRAFNRYCLHAGVPTLRLYHGLVRVQATSSNKQYSVNVISQAKFVLQRLPKALFKVWPCYLGGLWRTGARPSEWFRFVTDIFNLSRGAYISKGSDDSRTTSCAVYTQADIIHAVTKYGHSPEDVHVVGNPDLDAFGVDESLLGVHTGRSTADKFIIYVDTGLIYAGLVFTSENDFFEHLVKTRDELASQGFGLKAKLHPDHFRTAFPSRLQEAGIEVLTNQTYVDALKDCSAVIVEPSTASLIPGLVGCPMLLATYGKLDEQTYGEVLETYPRARKLEDVSCVKALLLEEAEAFQQEALEAWIAENAGPLPAKEMPDRVALLVEAMAKNFHGTALTPDVDQP